jgi:hypothetical protein
MHGSLILICKQPLLSPSTIEGMLRRRVGQVASWRLFAGFRLKTPPPTLQPPVAALAVLVWLLTYTSFW